MSTEILMPFSLGPDGRIATTQSPDTQVRQHVKSLIATQPGERVMMSSYGIPLKRFLFDPANPTQLSEIRALVSDALAKWETGLVVTDIKAFPDFLQQGIEKIEVQYTRTIDPDLAVSGVIHTATIKVGGEVVEIVRG